MLVLCLVLELSQAVLQNSKLPLRVLELTELG